MNLFNFRDGSPKEKDKAFTTGFIGLSIALVFASPCYAQIDFSLDSAPPIFRFDDFLKVYKTVPADEQSLAARAITASHDEFVWRYDDFLEEQGTVADLFNSIDGLLEAIRLARSSLTPQQIHALTRSGQGDLTEVEMTSQKLELAKIMEASANRRGGTSNSVIEMRVRAMRAYRLRTQLKLDLVENETQN